MNANSFKDTRLGTMITLSGIEYLLAIDPCINFITSHDPLYEVQETTPVATKTGFTLNKDESMNVNHICITPSWESDLVCHLKRTHIPENPMTYSGFERLFYIGNSLVNDNKKSFKDSEQNLSAVQTMMYEFYKNYPVKILFISDDENFIIISKENNCVYLPAINTSTTNGSFILTLRNLLEIVLDDQYRSYIKYPQPMLDIAQPINEYAQPGGYPQNSSNRRISFNSPNNAARYNMLLDLLLNSIKN